MGEERGPIRTLGNEIFGDPLLDDFRNFLHHAFGRVVGAEPTRVQYDIADFLWRGPGRFRMAEALRGVGKSLITSILVPWLIWRDWVRTDGRTEINIMVVSGTKDRADNFAHFCREVFYQVPELNPLIPQDGDTRWSTVAFDAAGASPAHMPTVVSRGIFGRMTGDRSDCIVFDDIEIPQNAETQGQRDKLRRRAAEFLDVIKPGGHLVGLGTPQVEDTVYHAIAGWGFTVRAWPAEYPSEEWRSRHGGKLAPLLMGDIEKDPAVVGRPVDPERFDAAELAIKRGGGRSRYALQYLLDTSLSDEDRYPLRARDFVVCDLSPGAAPADPIWSGAREHARADLPVLGMGGDTWQGAVQIKDPVWVPYDYKVMGLDPSGRGKDETALAIVGVIGGYLYLLRSLGLGGGYDERTLGLIGDEVERFRPDLIVPEDNFGDGMFEAMLGRYLRERGLRVPVQPVRHSTMKEARIIDSLEPVLNQHRLVVDAQVILDDRPGEGDQGESFRLFSQLTRVSRVRRALIHDDRLDALAIAVHHLTDRMNIAQTDFLRERTEAEERRKWDQWWDEVLPEAETPRGGRGFLKQGADLGGLWSRRGTR